MNGLNIRKLLILVIGIFLFFGANGLKASTYYVDATRGSNSNDGSSANSPWKTLARAENIIKNKQDGGDDVTLIIASGVYRERLFSDRGGKTYSNSKLVFQGKGDVLIKGSDQWNSDWTNEGGNIFSHPWRYNWGVANNPWRAHKRVVDPVVRRREMVFVNDVLLRQYLNYADLADNSYYVDESHHKLFIKLPANSDINKLNIEVATRGTGFAVNGYNNLELKNLKFQHFSTPFRNGAVEITNSSNVLIEDCNFTWNSDKGLNIGGRKRAPIQNIFLKRIKNNHNGINGLGIRFADNVLMEDFESSYNNWRGGWGGFHTWSPSNKLWSMRGLTMRRFVAKGNMATGLWLDTDNKDITIDDSLFEDNYMSGIYLENSEGPITIKNSIVRNNRYAGVNISNARDIVIEGNRIYGNYNKELEIKGLWDRDTRASQILVFGRNNGRSMYNRDTGTNEAVYSQNIKLYRNVIYGDTSYLIATWLDKNNWKIFLDSLDSDFNTWHSGHSEVFMPYDRQASTLSKWRSDTGEDLNSEFTLLSH